MSPIAIYDRARASGRRLAVTAPDECLARNRAKEKEADALEASWGAEHMMGWKLLAYVAGFEAGWLEVRPLIERLIVLDVRATQARWLVPG